MTEPGMVECPECGGDGEVEVECYNCSSMMTETCEECDGSGEVETTKENV